MVMESSGRERRNSKTFRLEGLGRAERAVLA
jgi:hypothetical protein